MWGCLVSDVSESEQGAEETQSPVAPTQPDDAVMAPEPRTDRRRLTVNAPVSVTFGPFMARLFPATSEQIAVDDFREYPWAWGGLVHAKFRIGEAVVTKRIKAKATGDRADDTPAASEGRSVDVFKRMEAEMRRLIQRHGIVADFPISWEVSDG